MSSGPALLPLQTASVRSSLVILIELKIFTVNFIDINIEQIKDTDDPQHSYCHRGNGRYPAPPLHRLYGRRLEIYSAVVESYILHEHRCSLPAQPATQLGMRIGLSSWPPKVCATNVAGVRAHRRTMIAFMTYAQRHDDEVGAGKGLLVESKPRRHDSHAVVSVIKRIVESDAVSKPVVQPRLPARSLTTKEPSRRRLQSACTTLP